MSYATQFGKWGEAYAGEYLEKQGIEIVARNVHTPFGEIDLVGREGVNLVFFEVKTRSSQTFGNPEDAVTPRKQEHLLNSALYFMQQRPEEDGSWRIDVISIIKSKSDGNPVQLEWFKNAVQ